MGIDNINNSFFNRSLIEQNNDLSNEDKSKILNIFDTIDNQENDNKIGVITTLEAINMFLGKIKNILNDNYNKFLDSINLNVTQLSSDVTTKLDNLDNPEITNKSSDDGVIILQDTNYKKVVSDFEINITDLQTGKFTKIDIVKLLEPLNPEERTGVLNVIKDLPSEVLIDISKEVTFSKRILKRKVSGTYDPNTDKIVLNGGKINKFTLVHELGHALDCIKSGSFTSTNNLSNRTKKFMSSFNDELNEYIKAGNVRCKYNDKDTLIIDEDKKSNYCTVNSAEIFAECYTFLMLGDCYSSKILHDYFPKTLECAKDIISQVRNLKDRTRH